VVGIPLSMTCAGAAACSGFSQFPGSDGLSVRLRERSVYGDKCATNVPAQTAALAELFTPLVRQVPSYCSRSKGRLVRSLNGRKRPIFDRGVLSLAGPGAATGIAAISMAASGNRRIIERDGRSTASWFSQSRQGATRELATTAPR
jgi:hypothetical protein